jgi:hypothetical protein
MKPSRLSEVDLLPIAGQWREGASGRTLDFYARKEEIIGWHHTRGGEPAGVLSVVVGAGWSTGSWRAATEHHAAARVRRCQCREGYRLANDEANAPF